MLSFRKSVAAAVVFCLVGLSTAWTFDVHTVDIPQADSLIDISDPAPFPDEHNHADDHCCHAGAHLVGLEQASILILPVMQSVPQSLASGNLFVSQTSSPPLRPPLS